MEFRVIKKDEFDTYTGNIVPVYYVQRKIIYECDEGFFWPKMVTKVLWENCYGPHNLERGRCTDKFMTEAEANNALKYNINRYTLVENPSKPEVLSIHVIGDKNEKINTIKKLISDFDDLTKAEIKNSL